MNKAFAVLLLLLGLARPGGTVGAGVQPLLGSAPSAFAGNATPEWIVDFRFAPPVWQTSICQPDDWQKTLVGRDGSLLYDYPGPFDGFGTRLSFTLADQEVHWVDQRLLDPRVPIVQTRKRAGEVEIVEEAFAVPPSAQPAKPRRPALVIEPVGTQGRQIGWAHPPEALDPAFRNVAIGWGKPLRYRFKARAGQSFVVVFGLCEGWHDQPGKRILELQIEGRTRRTVDPVEAAGKNQPTVFAFEAEDEDGDGWVELAVAAAPHSPDQNTFLNVLWVFEGGQTPFTPQLLLGHSTAPALVHLDCGSAIPPNQAPRYDVLMVSLTGRGAKPVRVVPRLQIQSQNAMQADTNCQDVLVAPNTRVHSVVAFETSSHHNRTLTLDFPAIELAPGQTRQMVFGIGRGQHAAPLPRDFTQAAMFRREAERFWRTRKLPYDRIHVPDSGIQSLLDSAVRNIYQAREIKNGLPAFQVGPTCYRGLWVVDGSFIMEAMTYLGRAEEARQGIAYLMSFQREDGGFMLIDGHWKETGIVLWAIARHARLTGDRAWLRSVWPQVLRGVQFIEHMRRLASKDPDAPNYGLVPDGFSDGGLAGKVPEYTNIYWTLAGWRAAIEAARWLGEEALADIWQARYDDFYGAFRRAAERDLRTDLQGHRYLPIRMQYDPKIPPQKAQWAFLHAVFPGRVFEPDDPLVQGNMAMLQAHECEGLVQDTGWLKDGLWNYFGSFYAHAWLWLGQGEKAARTLYAFANHASPLLVWREEHKPQGQGDRFVGDMPHNWASAEFIRLVRHLLVLERGEELHLFEGLPPAWTKPGATISMREVLTQFGPISFELTVSQDGGDATLELRPPRREPPRRIIMHLDTWTERRGTVELPLKRVVRHRVRLR